MNKYYVTVRTLHTLLLVLVTVFLLQSCVCKNCAMAVARPEVTPVKPSNALTDISTAPEAGSSVAMSGSNATGLQESNSSNRSLLIEDAAIVHLTAENEGKITSYNAADIPLTVHPNARPVIMTDKLDLAMFNAAADCPLGIRSIRSQLIGGPNLSFKSSKEGNDAYGNNGHKHEPGVGFQLGWGLELGFNEKFSVSPSLLLKQNNASEKIKYSYTEPGAPSGETTDKYSYTSLSAPVTANYKVGKQVKVFAGPEVNYLLKASVKRKGSSGNDSKENITKNSVKLGVGVQAGVKYQFPSASGDSPFGIQLLYEHRLSRLNKKNTDGYSYSTPAWNMKGFQVGVTCSLCELMKGRN